MRNLQWVLAIFIPILSFSIVPASVKVAQATLYPARLFLLLGLVFFGGLLAIAIKGRALSILEYFSVGIRQISILSVVTFFYVACVIISAWTSPMPIIAWVGQSYLQFGSIMLLVSLGAAVLYAKNANVNLIVRLLISTTLIMLGLTILEAIGLRPLSSWLYSERMIYPAATVGHRQHLGGWFAIVALMPIFFYRYRRKDIWFWVWILAGLLGVALTTTTAASIGVVAGLFTLVVHGILKRDWRIPVSIFSFFILCLYVVPLAVNKISNLMNLTPVILKDYGSTSSFKPRLYLWKAAFNASLKRPYTGWGDETFSYQLYNHLNDSDIAGLIRSELSLNGDYALEKNLNNFFMYNSITKDRKFIGLIYVRAHNIIFDELYSRGVLGFFIFLLLIVVFLIQFYKLDRRGLIYFFIAFCPYSVYLLAWFYVPTVTPLFFILLGVALADAKNVNINSPNALALSHARN